MANPNPVCKFPPGVSGNPGGRPKAPEHLRHIKPLRRVETCRLIAKYSRMTAAELIAAKDNPNTPVIELAIASIYISCIEKGDFTRLLFLFEQAMGRTPTAEDSAEEIAARIELAQLTDEEFVRIAKQKIAEIEAKKSE